MAKKQRISVEELRVRTQIDTLIGRMERGQDLLPQIAEFDEPFRDLIYSIDRALRAARQEGRDEQ